MPFLFSRKSCDEQALGQTPLDWLNYWASRKPDAAFLMYRDGAAWRKMSWKVAQQKVRRLASFLQSVDVKPGELVAILSNNHPLWIIADLAICAIGAVCVPIYPEVSQPHLDQILEKTRPKVIFRGKLNTSVSIAQLSDVLKIAFDAAREGERELAALFESDTVASIGLPLWWDLDAPASITFTSGTTGGLKGAMHSLRQMTAAARGVLHERPFVNSRYLAYMSFAHVGERMGVEYVCLLLGGTIFINAHLTSFLDDLRQARPTSFIAVPRVWNQLRRGIEKKIPYDRLNLLLKIPVIRQIVGRAIRKSLGLEQANAIITGSAPSDLGILKYFDDVGINIREGFALTENFAYSHRNLKEARRLRSVGLPCPGVRTKIADDGEILVASPANMIGYYDDPEATSAAFEGEYMRTGDLGRIDGEGYLWVVGRKKDSFKTASGKYVNPAPIEAMLEANAIVDRAIVLGSDAALPMALVQLTESDSNNRDAIGQQLALLRSKINATVEAHSKLAKIVVVSDGWQTNPRFVTPTAKLKRRELEQYYEPCIPAWAGSASPIVWGVQP